jgi:hypothetical protein
MEIGRAILHHLDEGPDDVGVELGAGPTGDLFEGLRAGPGLPIRAVVRDGVERVDDREDPCRRRDVLAAQPVRIAPPRDASASRAIPTA